MGEKFISDYVEPFCQEKGRACAKNPKESFLLWLLVLPLTKVQCSDNYLGLNPNSGHLPG